MPVSPSDREDEYFAKLDYEKKRKVELEKHQKLAADERKRLKDLHYMKCPKCGMELIELAYKNIKIDKCSECEGIWLDAGELEAASKCESGINRLFGMFK